MEPASAVGFFAYARERERIRLAREGGMAPPWTEDPVLQQYRFCNVFREDDRVTRAFRQHLREPLQNDQRVFMACVAFRLFNTEVAAQRLGFLCGPGWSADACRRAMRDVKPVTNAAYIISTPAGKDKLDGVIEVISNVNRRKMQIIERAEGCCMEEHPVTPEHKCKPALTLKETHEWLCQFPHIGNFIAYEIVTDLAHTWMLEQAPDRRDWASFGPGAARGLEWIFYGTRKDLPREMRVRYTSRQGQRAMLKAGLQLLLLSRYPPAWPTEWRQWTMREVEHTLCEYDKYERARQLGKRLKRRYLWKSSSPVAHDQVMFLQRKR